MLHKRLWHENRECIRTDYLTNKAGDSRLDCLRYKAVGSGNGTTPVQSGGHASGELDVVCTTDEDGNTSYRFTDKLGCTVLQRKVDGNDTYDTYYVYDDRGNLCFVLPPRIREEGTSQGKPDALAYCYRYDSRDRCVLKKLPGTGAVRYVYDKADHPVFIQDGNLREQDKWQFTIPDAFGRPALSGICSDTLPAGGGPVEAEFTGSGTYKGYVVKVGGTVRELPGSSLLTANYYDNYDFAGKNGVPASLQYAAPPSGYGTRYTGGSKGLLTGTVTVRLDASGATGYDYAAYYYDNRGRIVQARRTNHLGGTEVEYVAYNFVGDPVKRQRVHTAEGKTTQTEVYSYTYDHAGRLLTVKHKWGSRAEVALITCTYDELGRLQTKSLHGSASNTLNYSYNVRDWLTGISGTKFKQNLYYNAGSGTPCYNGNISSMTWQAGSETTLRGYKFAYDGLNRLTAATYGEGGTIATNPNRFTEKVTSYGKNGNILALQRYGQTAASAYGLIDNLTLTYNGNQLTRADDAVAASAYGGGFKDGVKLANE